jgi:hypothetical protein
MLTYMMAIGGGAGAGWLWSQIPLLKDPGLNWAAGLFSLAGASGTAAVSGGVLTEAALNAKAERIFLGLVFLASFWAMKWIKAN